jgi:5'-nucleotidase
MRILISNDDGIHAPGLVALENIARTLSDDVWVVAPETDQSGFAHSLTLHDPLRARKFDERRFSVRGTPTDCVIMGVRHLLPGKPDLVLSGVNAGTNMADDVTYSGTVACAIEATLLGIPAVALSQAYEDFVGRIPFETAEALGPDVLKKIVGQGIAHGTFVNVNFPNCAPEAVAGVEVTRQGNFAYDHGIDVEKRIDARRKPYYWLTFKRGEMLCAQGTDAFAISQNKVSVTPLRLDLTDGDAMERMRALF